MKMNLITMLFAMLLPVAAMALPIPTVSPGALPVGGVGGATTSTGKTSADVAAERAAVTAAKSNVSAAGKVADCSEKIKKAAEDKLAQEQANIVNGMKDVKEKGDSFLSCLSKYGKIGVNTSLQIPSPDTIMDQINKMACAAADAAVAKATASFSKGVQYNDGIINAGGTINPVVFGGTKPGVWQGSTNTRTNTNVNVPNILN